MAYSVHISGQVKAVLEQLAESDPPRARELALLLVTLGKTPKPSGSREIVNVEDPMPGERVWNDSGFEILYRVDASVRRVDIGVVDDERLLWAKATSEESPPDT